MRCSLSKEAKKLTVTKRLILRCREARYKKIGCVSLFHTQLLYSLITPTFQIYILNRFLGNLCLGVEEADNNKPKLHIILKVIHILIRDKESKEIKRCTILFADILLLYNYYFFKSL